jgi:hypothetical protein
MLAVEDSPAGLESAKAAGCSGLSLGRAGRSRSFAFRGRPAAVVVGAGASLLRAVTTRRQSVLAWTEVKSQVRWAGITPSCCICEKTSTSVWGA